MTALTTDTPFELRAVNIVGLFIVFIVAALANSAGLGGGAVFVPMFNVLIGFALKAATGLSQAVIAGGAIASVSFNLWKHHPEDRKKPLIDFQLVLMFTPVLLIGVNTGVLFNQMFPDWIITILLVLLIAGLTVSALHRGLILWKEENIKKASHVDLTAFNDSKLTSNQHLEVELPPVADTQDTNAPDQQPRVSAPNKNTAGGDDVEFGSAGAVVKPRAQGAPVLGRGAPILGRNDLFFASLNKVSMHMLHHDFVHHPHDDSIGAKSHGFMELSKHTKHIVLEVFMLVALWVAFVVLQVYKGKEEKCSSPYWGLYSTQVVLMCVAAVGFTALVLRDRKEEEEEEDARTASVSVSTASVGGARKDKGLTASSSSTDDVSGVADSADTDPKSKASSEAGGGMKLQYTFGRLLGFQAITAVAGMVTGLLGVGGSLVMSPLLLELGVQPQVTAATACMMTMFASGSAVLQLATAGKLNDQYAAIFASTALVGSLAGVAGVAKFVKKSGRSSVIVMVLAGVIATGGVVTAVVGGMRAAKNFKAGHHIGFQSLC